MPQLDLATVTLLAQSISGAMDRNRLLESFIQMLLAHTSALWACVLLTRDEHLEIAAEDSASAAPIIYPTPIALTSDYEPLYTLAHRVRRSGQSVLEESFVNEEPRSALCVPMTKTGVIGMVYLEGRAGTFAPDQMHLVQILATQAAISLENAYLYAAVKEEMAARQRSEAVLRAITKGTATVTGDDFFYSFVRHLAEAFQVRHAFVTEFVDSAIYCVRTLAYFKDGAFAENVQYDLADTPCEAVIAGSIRHYPQGLASHFPLHAGDESYLGVPLCDSNGEVLGHVAVIDDKPMKHSHYELSLIQIFATRAGVELERKRAEDTLRRSQQELRQLNLRLEDYNRNLEATVIERTHETDQRRRVAESLGEMLTIVNSNRPLKEILDYIVARACQLLGARSAAVFELQNDGQTLLLQASVGLPDEYAEALSFPLDRSFMGRAVICGQPVIISDIPAALATEDVALSPRNREILATTCRTLLATPLIRQDTNGVTGDVFGGFALYYPQPREFTAEELRLSIAFSAQATLAVETARLRQQVEQAAVRQERSRLARELHDSVTQLLYSLTLLAEGWKRMARAGQAGDIEEMLGEIGEIGQQALKEMRLLVYELRPPDLEQQGLVGALYQRLAAVEKRAGIEARLTCGTLGEFPPAVEDVLYRIAQEALNNALKHAAATHVTVNIERVDGQVKMVIEDDGTGFDPSAESSRRGIGLSSMHERAQRMGGCLAVESTSGCGATVRVRIPIEKR